MTNNSPYSGIINIMRNEGQANSLPGIILGTMVSNSKISLLGALISQDIYKLEGVEVAPGDIIAVQRIGEINLILGKVVEL